MRELGKHIINIDHQLQRNRDMTLTIQETKTNAGTKKLPMTEDVEECFSAIIAERPVPLCERIVDGYSVFLFLDEACLSLVAMHWEHRFQHMVDRYNDIYRVQMPRQRCTGWRRRKLPGRNRKRFQGKARESLTAGSSERDNDNDGRAGSAGVWLFFAR